MSEKEQVLNGQLAAGAAIQAATNTYNQYQGDLKIVIPNKFVACKPYQAVENKGSVFSDWQLKNPFVELEVVFSDKEGEYIPGSNVYVRPFLDVPGWIKDVFSFCGKEVILVPKEYIVGYKYVEIKPPVPQYDWTQVPKWPYDVYKSGYLGGAVIGSSGVSTSITWTDHQQKISQALGSFSFDSPLSVTTNTNV